MSLKFIDALETENNYKHTENGMLAMKSTKNDLLDLFGTIGALRSREDFEIARKFSMAASENELLAVAMAFYARDIRNGGLGERRTSRIIFEWLGENRPELMINLMHLIPFYGRWDDLFVFFGTKIEKYMIEYVCLQLKNDVNQMREGGQVSLLAKWMPSKGPLVKVFCKELGFSEKVYRQTLSKLRKYLKIVEVDMSANKWSNIDYSIVPSKAMLNYRNAFSRHEPFRFKEYLENLQKGKTKINASTLYPYDLVEEYMDWNSVDKVVEAQWKSLPNYVDGEHNILVMADVSGSMIGRPMATSVGLAIYFAERNSGPYHNKFMTFSADPELVSLKGKNLCEKVHNAMNEDWGMNTDIVKTMDLILRTSIKANLTNDELPKALVIISDMEFDESQYDSGESMEPLLLNELRVKFAEHNYELPKIVFWNVDARNDTFHATADEEGIYLVSGSSSSSFKGLLTHLNGSSYELMLETLGPYVAKIQTGF